VAGPQQRAGRCCVAAARPPPSPASTVAQSSGCHQEVDLVTDTITRPASSAARSRAVRQRSLVLSGVVSAAGAAALGLLACLSIVVLAWATDPNSSGTSAGLARTAARLWLLSHGGSIVVRGEPITLAPLSLTVVVFVLIARGAAAAARVRRACTAVDALGAALSVAAPYALVVAVVAAAAQTPQLRTQPVRALLTGLALAAVAASAGGLRQVGWHEVTRAWPAAAKAIPAAVAAAVCGVVATGAALVAASLMADFSQVSVIARSVEGAGAAGLALLVVQVVLAPNAVVWASAYAAGTGFAVGVGTHVGPAGSTMGAVPALPLLAALPVSGPAPALAQMSVAGVLIAGAFAGVVLARRMDGTPQHLVAVWMALTALAAAATFGVLCWLAAGSAPGTLAQIGPQPAQSAAAVAQWLVLSGVPAAWITSWRGMRHVAP
jgi:hypothetical protein